MNVACSIGLHFSSRTSINVDHSGNLMTPECHEFKAFGSCKHESLHLLIFLACLDGHNLHQLSTRDIKTILYDETSGSAGSSSSLVSGWVQTCCDQNAAVKLLGRSSAQCVQPVKLARHKIGQIVGLASSHQSVLFIQFWSVLHLWLERTAHDALLRWSSCFCSHPEHRLGLQPLPGMLPKAAVSKDMRWCLAAY